MGEETTESEKPFLRGSGTTWDWWGENPGEIVLVVFLLTLFFFFYSLPPQGWGVDPNPNVAPENTAPANAAKPE